MRSFWKTHAYSLKPCRHSSVSRTDRQLQHEQLCSETCLPLPPGGVLFTWAGPCDAADVCLFVSYSNNGYFIYNIKHQEPYSRSEPFHLSTYENSFISYVHSIQETYHHRCLGFLSSPSCCSRLMPFITKPIHTAFAMRAFIATWCSVWMRWRCHGAVCSTSVRPMEVVTASVCGWGRSAGKSGQFIMCATQSEDKGVKNQSMCLSIRETGRGFGSPYQHQPLGNKGGKSC